MPDTLIPLHEAESQIYGLEKIFVLFRMPRRTLVKPYPYKRALKEDATVFDLYLRLVSWLKSQDHLFGTKFYPRIINATSIVEMVEILDSSGEPVYKRMPITKARNKNK
jgi:hypothetical protein